MLTVSYQGNDIAQAHDIPIDNELIRNHPRLIHDLSRDLDTCHVSAPDWRSLGSRLGLTFQHVMSYERRRQPTVDMLNDIDSLRVRQVAEALDSMKCSNALDTIKKYKATLKAFNQKIILIIYTDDIEGTAEGLREKIKTQTEDKFEIIMYNYSKDKIFEDRIRRAWMYAHTIIFLCSAKNLQLFTQCHPCDSLPSIQPRFVSDQFVTSREIGRDQSIDKRSAFVLCGNAAPTDFMQVFGVRNYFTMWQAHKLISYVQRSASDTSMPPLGCLVEAEPINIYNA